MGSPVDFSEFFLLDFGMANADLRESERDMERLTFSSLSTTFKLGFFSFINEFTLTRSFAVV